MRVVVAAEAVLLRHGLARALETQGIDVVGEAADAGELLRLVRELRPDVAVTGLGVRPAEGDEGLAAAEAIQADHPTTGVLVLARWVDERSAVRLLERGVAGIGYLLEDRIDDPRALEQAVRRVGAGGTALDPEVVEQLLVRPRVSEDPLDQLTPREREVMAMMADGLSNRAMASALAVTERAVERHVTGIFGKLGLGADGACHRRVVAVLRYVRRDAAVPAAA